MFGATTEKLKNVFSSLSRVKTLTEENLSDAVREIRLALLDADVNYSITKDFIKRIKEKAIGTDVIKSVSPSEKFAEIIHTELVTLMGTEESPLTFAKSPYIMMLVGLQGSGKTTQCAKLAHLLQKKEYQKKSMLVACDLQRPAAVKQLKILGDQINVPVFSIEGESNPTKVVKGAVDKAKKEGIEVVILDTAGRLHIDDDLMKELETIKSIADPSEILFVASAATGQEAPLIAKEFDERLSITGSILTMLDGSARAGAAISIAEITKKPLKFEGIGEKVADFQIFNPTSMADRILGMGDIINLVKKAEEHLDDENSKDLEKKLRKASFTFDDYLKQMSMMKKMGSFKGILKMLPGMPSELGDLDLSEKETKRTEAIILSMTKKERSGLVEIDFSRRRRIAKGSGTALEDVNKLLKGFKRIKKLFKKMPRGKGSNLDLKDPDLQSKLSSFMK